MKQQVAMISALIGVVATAACGSTSSVMPDGAPAQVDASTPNIKVTVYNAAGALASGLPVAFLDADDKVVSETTTAADGTASAVIAAGASVTIGASGVVNAGGNPPAVYTQCRSDKNVDLDVDVNLNMNATLDVDLDAITSSS